MLGTFLSLPLLILAGTDGSGDSIAYSFRLVEVRPGCSEDGVGYPVSIVVRATVVNQTSRPLILSREFAAAPYYRLAASVDRADRGEYEATGGDLEIQSADVPEPKVGYAPDSARFVVLSPGATYEADARTGFLAGNRRALEELSSGRTAGFVLPGQHVIRSLIRTWPYLFIKSSTVEHLRHRWRRIGDLVTESIETPYLSFELPDAWARCDQR